MTQKVKRFMHLVKMAFLEFDNLLQGWKIFLAFAMTLVAIWFIPGEKVSAIVATATVALGLIARASKLYNEKKEDD